MNNFIQDINKLNNDNSIDNKEDNYFNSLTTETFSRNKKNSDVINLSELSKIKLEYERDDVKMNNGQFNNNFGQPELNQGPAFGGRFFPSLEDEPTNMNMMGGLNNEPSIPPIPATQEPMGVPTPPNMNNNLIDLTDLSIENEPKPTAISSFGTSQAMPPLNGMQNNNSSVVPSTGSVSMDILNADFGTPSAMSNFGATSTPSMPEPMGMPNLSEDLNVPQSSNFGEQMPVQNFGSNQQPIIDTPQMMETPSAMSNFGATSIPSMPEPMGMPTPSVNLNVSQSSNFGEQMPVQNFRSNQQPIIDTPQMMETSSIMPSFGTNQNQIIPSIPEPMGISTPSVDINIPQPQNRNFDEPMTIPNFDTNVSIPSFDNNISMPDIEINTKSQKDVTPVTNTIKNLVNNLKEFGYKINIIEDDLINVSKLTIEIEK